MLSGLVQPFPLRAVVRAVGKPALKAATRLATHHWRPYTRLFLVGDGNSWVLSREMREIAQIAQQTGISVADPHWARYAQNQTIFYSNRYHFLVGQWTERPNRVGTTYLHGRPGSGEPEFDKMYRQLCRLHHYVHRIWVSHSEMYDVVLGTGIAPEKVFLIPIGINLSFFYPQTAKSRRRARAEYGIPESAVVVGSFQKDGVGWGEGDQPKLIKGPDIFLKTIEALKPRVPELFVLLSGVARGYIKAGLERLGVPYRHIFLKNYPEIGTLFQALDLYIVASRQEGGPKAVLEAMASGVPLVTTRVGQAMDLVRHGENGWMVEVEDVEGLTHWAEFVINHRGSVADVISRGYQTAQENSYQAQTPLWRNFMRGFVEWEDSFENISAD